MKRLILALLFLYSISFVSSQTPYIYFSWSVSGIDSTSQFTSSVKCAFDFNNQRYYESCAKIEETDSSFFIGISKSGNGFIYDFVIEDSTNNKLMLIRMVEPEGLIVHVDLGSVPFQEGYFEPALLSKKDTKGNTYYWFEPEWDRVRLDFNDRTLETLADKQINRQLRTSKRN